jgi:predicted molibdopterin-dependent oxidoreductase YjgC
MALLKRIAETRREIVEFTLDGRACQALAGDTVLTAVLSQQDRLRVEEFNGAPRAGFCLMGACQDCWMLTEAGTRLRACSTFITPGMRLISVPV